MNRYKFYNEVIIEAENKDQAIEEFANQSHDFAPNATCEEIASNVSFTGVEVDIQPKLDGKYYEASLKNMGKKLLCTDGVMQIAKTHGAHWLVDVVASWLSNLSDETFAVVTLRHEPRKDEPNGFIFQILDDLPHNKVYAKQYIEFSDFPEQGVRMYLGRNGSDWVLYLPQEH